MRTTTVVTLLACLVLGGCSAGKGDGSAEPRGPRYPASDGTQFVGAEGMMVAVPESWEQVGRNCGFAQVDGSYYVGDGSRPQPSDYASFYEELQDECAFDGERLPSNYLQVQPGGALITTSLVEKGEATPTVPPAPTLASRDGFTVDYRHACTDGTCRATWSVADHGVLFDVEVDGPDRRAALAAMDASLQAVPEGWTAADDGSIVRDEG